MVKESLSLMNTQDKNGDEVILYPITREDAVLCNNGEKSLDEVLAELNKGTISNIRIDGNSVIFTVSGKDIPITVPYATNASNDNNGDNITDTYAKKTAVDSSINSASTALENKISTAKTELNAKIDDAKAVVEESISNTSDTLEGKITTAKNEMNTKIDNTKTTLDNSITTKVNATNTALEKSKPIFVPYTILASKWVNGSVTITLTGVDGSSTCVLSSGDNITSEQLSAFLSANIIATSEEGSTSITLTATETVPTIDLNINLMIYQSVGDKSSITVA